MVSSCFASAAAGLLAGQASARSAPVPPAAASCPADGWPLAAAGPGRQRSGVRPTCVQAAVPVTGPLSSVPSGAEKYPWLPVSTMVPELAVPAALKPPAVPGTGAQTLLPAGEVSRKNRVQLAAKSGPVPVHRANTANASLPTVSRLVTRIPPVPICVQCWPPSRVAHSSGPKAHPYFVLRNRIWLTPVPPAGAVVAG